VDSKGGVGKSLAGNLVAQHLRAEGIETICFDVHAMTATLSGLPAPQPPCAGNANGRGAEPPQFPGGSDEQLQTLPALLEKASDDLHAAQSGQPAPRWLSQRSNG
jgi:hypothetical protein